MLAACQWEKAEQPATSCVWGLGRSSQVVAGKQTSPGSVAGHQDAGRNGAISHRRVVGGRVPSYLGTEEPPWGHWATQDLQALRIAIYLHKVGGSNLGSFIDQSAEGRRLVGEKEKFFQAGPQQEGRPAASQKRRNRQRVNRFLRWPVLGHCWETF